MTYNAEINEEDTGKLVDHYDSRNALRAAVTGFRIISGA